MNASHMRRWAHAPVSDFPAPQEPVEYIDWINAQQLGHAAAAAIAAGGTAAATAPADAAPAGAAAGTTVAAGAATAAPAGGAPGCTALGAAAAGAAASAAPADAAPAGEAAPVAATVAGMQAGAAAALEDQAMQATPKNGQERAWQPSALPVDQTSDVSDHRGRKRHANADRSEGVSVIVEDPIDSRTMKRAAQAPADCDGPGTYHG
jgi:hypothetical protein